MALTDISEATPDTTSDDIKAYVEQVATEVESERKGEQEPKSDAQITSEHAGTPQPGDRTNKTPAEKNSGRKSANDGEKAAEVDDQGDESGESEGPEWFTDDVKAEAAAYGIDKSEIADFASREELDRALRLFDKSALEAGRKALAEPDGESDEGSTRNEKGRFAKKEAPDADDPPAKRKVEGRYEFKADIYDEDLEEDLKGFRDYADSRVAALEERLQAYEERFAEADAVAKERHFDNMVDSLGHADLFGVTDKETAQEKQRREDLFVEVETYLRGRESLGRPAELNDTILNRIARSLFAEELGKKELKQRTRKISRQSNGRQGGGATRPSDPRQDPRDEFDRLYRELEGV